MGEWVLGGGSPFMDCDIPGGRDWSMLALIIGRNVLPV